MGLQGGILSLKIGHVLLVLPTELIEPRIHLLYSLVQFLGHLSIDGEGGVPTARLLLALFLFGDRRLLFLFFRFLGCSASYIGLPLAPAALAASTSALPASALPSTALAIFGVRWHL